MALFCLSEFLNFLREVGAGGFEGGELFFKIDGY
jgi:hypothetical protein